jgi:glycosyltransferase involved in cell wall biosynthesis
LPYPPFSGTGLVLAEVMTRLAGDHEFTVVGYGPPDQTPGVLPESVRVFPMEWPRRSPLSKWLEVCLKGTPVEAVGLESGLLDCVRELTSSQKFDVAHVTGPPLAGIGRYLEGIPKVLAALDAWHLNARALTAETRGPRRQIRKLAERRIERFQASVFPLYDAVITVSEQDASELKHLSPGLVVRALPNGVDTTHFSPAADAGERDPNLLLFVGTMSWEPNIHAAEFLASEILPRVRADHPAARVAIVGRDASPTTVQRLQGYSGVDVIGEVEDVATWLHQAAVFCSPMLDGTGIKNKVLEALSCAVPTVASTLSCRGLSVQNGEEVLVADTAADFAQAVSQLLGNSAEALIIGDRGREYVCREHRWDAVAARVASLYEEAVVSAEQGSPIAADWPRG